MNKKQNTLELDLQIEGDDKGAILLALSEVTRLIGKGELSGEDGHPNASFEFTIKEGVER